MLGVCYDFKYEVRAGLIEKVTSEKRPEGGEGMSFVDTGGGHILGTRDGSVQPPEVDVCLICSSSLEEVRMGEREGVSGESHWR